MVTLAPTQHAMPCQAFHELVLIRPHKEIPRTEKAIYFWCDFTGSIQISRSFSSWRRFINNNLIVFSPGGQWDSPPLLMVSYVSYVADRVHTRTCPWRLWAWEREVGLLGWASWLWAASPELCFSEGCVGTALWSCDTVSSSLSLLVHRPTWSCYSVILQVICLTLREALESLNSEIGVPGEKC